MSESIGDGEHVWPIGVVVAQSSLSAAEQADLVERLVEREESIADVLRLSAVQFGLYPEIVAEVLAQVGLGRPISVEQRAMVHTNFHALMQRLHDEQSGEQG